MLNHTPDNITYLILAGGRGQRMNGVDKGLMHWQGKPMIEHVLAQLNATPAKTIISANRNIQTYEQYANCVISDTLSNYQGPLSGILTAMHACNTEYLLCVPCDSPTPPDDMLNQLWHCMHSQQKISAICHDGERLQPLFALLPCTHKTLLSEYLQQGQRKVEIFMQKIDPAVCDFSAQKNHFNNFNRQEDMLS